MGNPKYKDGTIGNKGCTLTAICNWHNAVFKTNITPRELNDILSAKNLYSYDGSGYAVINWVKLPQALPYLKFVYRDWNYNNPIVWAWINMWPRVPVIVQVRISAKFPSHFVLAIGGGKIVDSLDGKIKAFGTYTNPIGSARLNRA